MICEVQIRVTGAPDDHIMYEIRRNLKPQARFLLFFFVSSPYHWCFFFSPKLLPECIRDFFSDVCNFNFTPYAKGRQLTLYQDEQQIRQSVAD